MWLLPSQTDPGDEDEHLWSTEKATNTAKDLTAVFVVEQPTMMKPHNKL